MLNYRRVIYHVYSCKYVTIIDLPTLGGVNELDIEAIKSGAAEAVHSLFSASMAVSNEDIQRVAQAAGTRAQAAAESLGLDPIQTYVTVVTRIGGGWGTQPVPQTATGRQGAAPTPLARAAPAHNLPAVSAGTLATAVKMIIMSQLPEHQTYGYGTAESMRAAAPVDQRTGRRTEPPEGPLRENL